MQRKKEKRLEKQNAIKALSSVSVFNTHTGRNVLDAITSEVLKAAVSLSSLFMSSPEGEERNSETHEREDFIESDGEKNGPTVESAETQNPTQTTDDEERSEAGEEEEEPVRAAEEEDVEIKVCGLLLSSGGSFAGKMHFLQPRVREGAGSGKNRKFKIRSQFKTCDRAQWIPQQRRSRKGAENLLVKTI